MKLKNVPNILSVTRLLLVPFFVYLFLNDFVVPAVIVFIIAGATDVVDGYVARTYNCTSTMGKILDPLADKCLQLSAFICLWLKDYILWWMPLIYFIKELATALGALFIFRKSKFVVKSNVFGKLATVFVFGAVVVIVLFGDAIGDFGKNAICVAVALYFVFSVGVYCGEELLKMIRGAKVQKNADPENK